MRTEMTRIAGGNDISKIVESCKQLFNQWCGFDFFHEDNLKVKILTSKEGIAGYECFCKQYFPSYLDKYSDDYTAEGYIDTFGAQAFVNGTLYGILLRSGTAENSAEWYDIILHEMSHIFCIAKEANGANFFHSYCIDDENGVIVAGYAVWREFIADYISAHINPFFHWIITDELREQVRLWDQDVFASNKDAKLAVSCLLADIFLNKQVNSSNNMGDILRYLDANRIFSSKAILEYYIILLETIFQQVSKNEFWKISVDFIESVGSAYLGLLVRKTTETR